MLDSVVLKEESRLASRSLVARMQDDVVEECKRDVVRLLTAGCEQLGWMWWSEVANVVELSSNCEVCLLL